MPYWNLIFNGEISASSLQQISPVSFAYIGDAVYELYVRTNFLLPPQKISDYHHQVVEKVRAEAQAAYLQNLYPILTEIELNWVRRGRNSVNKSPRRLSLQIYQQATGLETLLGYLYICDRPRLEYLLSQLEMSFNKNKKKQKS
ncbi:ribonuclease III domain-containing protein [Geminocystis sp. GBBB08]|uniref:Mini-ribonuclease 3 n=1 Tax=Geminocystis sp. GBBB08 TaxID=2604140 RepID=UPI0027E22192|nr:ribonuclease III domain-containing protein [Geminocystis sp. GBBB08]